MPQFVMAFGTTVEDVRQRMRWYYEAREEELDVDE